MALNCNNPNFVGKNVLVEYALACGDVNPRTLSYAPVGSMRGKDLTLSADTVDTTADDSSGGFRSNLVTFKTLEFTGDGVVRVSSVADTGQTILLDHFVSEDQPVAWFRFTYPDRTIYAYSIITELSRSAPFDEVVTYSLTTMGTDTGSTLYPAVIVDKTPAPATSITLAPATTSVVVGATRQLTATILPNDGATRNVSYASSNPAIATINSSGLITGVAVGTATVTGKVGSKIASTAVTVTAT